MKEERKETYVDNNLAGSTGRTAGEGGGLKRRPDEWKTGGEPMTCAQKSYLQTLAREANEDAAAPAAEGLTKAEAAKRIDKLQKKTGRGRRH